MCCTVAQALVVHRIEHSTSKAACLEAVGDAQHDISIDVAVFTANMRHVTQRQISMLRQMIDDAQAGAAQEDNSMKWILLLHSNPGGGMHDSYPQYSCSCMAGTFGTWTAVLGAYHSMRC